MKLNDQNTDTLIDFLPVVKISIPNSIDSRLARRKTLYLSGSSTKHSFSFKITFVVEKCTVLFHSETSNKLWHRYLFSFCAADRVYWKRHMFTVCFFICSTIALPMRWLFSYFLPYSCSGLSMWSWNISLSTVPYQANHLSSSLITFYRQVLPKTNTWFRSNVRWYFPNVAFGFTCDFCVPSWWCPTCRCARATIDRYLNRVIEQE